MKKVLAAVAITLFLSSTYASACHGPDCSKPPTTVVQDGWAYSANIQGQAQGFTGDYGSNWIVGAGGGAQYQAGIGATSADKGNLASDSQYQEQGTFAETGTADNFIWGESHQIAEGGGQAAGSKRSGGEYEYEGIQAQAGIGGAINDGNGTAGFGGSGYVGIGSNYASAGDNSSAYQSQSQDFRSGYYQLNQGSNGHTEVYGTQEVNTYNGVNVQSGGDASSYVGVIQAGGSGAVNNGKGTAMIGGSGSGAYGIASASSDRCATAEAGYEATQTHGYTQSNVSNNGNQWQVASGQTSTTIVGGVKN